MDARRRSMRPRRPIPRMDPSLERLSDMLLALLSQLTVVRERLDTVERLIERHGLFPQREVEEFSADAATEGARSAIRRGQIERVLRPLLDESRRAVETSARASPAGVSAASPIEPVAKEASE